ncbi:TonB family protein [Aquimarina sp. BL5]|uniref:toxin-antitoxin system YwqK family antitoxin n=1 Tax=Aquimarina sp. BL5 TaxID=1714860 RepID=UPI000E4AC93C|nr:TonB family protein [Aquimarina sp. BL5]AXT49499.1 TonB family protein [Aquimarina sp. BL5]RKN02509.1 TonB family protein [Aquimarina sp. BL5]
MKNYYIFSLFLIIVTTCIAQKEPSVDTTYLRYNRSPGYATLSNYVVVKTKLASGAYEFKEYYRFNEPMSLKATYEGFGNGKKHGFYKEYTKDIFIKEEGEYKDDKKVGEWIYYKKGQLQCKVSYVDDKKEGASVYYANGKELYTWHYKNGKSHGHNKSYHDDGTPKFEGTYIEGKLNGKATEYDKKGFLRTISFYEKGKRHGAFTRYRSDGNVMGAGTYAEGKEIGEWIWYRKNGSIASRELYSEKGRLKKATFYNEKGEEIKTRKKDVFTGVIEEKKKLKRIIQAHVKGKFNYPQTMYQRGIEGKVFVKFKIKKDGNVSDIDYRSDTHNSLEIQAKNLIASIPKQKPAIIHNLPMDVWFSIPMVFRIKP